MGWRIGGCRVFFRLPAGGKVFGFSATDLDPAQAKINELNPKNRIRPPQGGEDFAMRISRGAVGGLSVDRLRFTGSPKVDAEPFSGSRFSFVREGRWHGATRHDEPRGRAGLTRTVVPDAVRYQAPDFDGWIPALSEGVVRPMAVEQFGQDRLRFVAMAPVGAGRAENWRNTSAFVRRQLQEHRGLLREQLLHAQTVNLAALVLVTFPKTAMTTDQRPGPDSAGPAPLLRAPAFMEANAERSLPLSDVAFAARTSPRALRDAFRRQRGTSPLRCLRRIRLEYAHRNLLDPDIGCTVGEIAHRWEFVGLGRFAVAYRRTCGRPPQLAPCT